MSYKVYKKYRFLDEKDVAAICTLADQGFSASTICHTMAKYCRIRIKPSQVWYLTKRNDSFISLYRMGASSLAHKKIMNIFQRRSK